MNGEWLILLEPSVRPTLPLRRFKLREPVYRLAENEWKAFVEEFTDLLIDVDPEIPPLPPKDVIHRIYRDVCRHPWLTIPRPVTVTDTFPDSFQQRQDTV